MMDGRASRLPSRVIYVGQPIAGEYFVTDLYREECVMRKTAVLTALAVMTVLVVSFAACGGGNSQPASQMATVKLSVSDPPTCGSAQGGQYDAIYVAIQDVQIHTSATAGGNDPGWVDLTPNLKAGAPMQVNLLGIRDNECVLAMLN